MSRQRPPRLSHCLALSLALVLSACETLLASQAVEEFPPEGELVEVADGRRLQLDCRGDGGPTVIFQSGGDMMGALAWRPVHDRVAQTTRACAYSRAGILWSDPASTPFSPEEVARDLHAALDQAGESGPYILVGHSRGGLYNLIFAGLYKDEIAGMVFADSSHPDQEEQFAEAGIPQRSYVSATQEIGLALRWTGLLRLQPYPVDPSIAPEVEAFYPRSAAANAREARHRDETLALAGRYRDLQNWPVVVLAREPAIMTQAWHDRNIRNDYLLSSDGLSGAAETPASEAVWRKLQADLATWSSRGRLEIVPESGHAFFFHKPDVIVSAVREVLAAARLVRREPPVPY